ncbi:hypothetical protein [Pseudoduganella lutea]|uniref:Uncharacterized protein n=1 Tax=Pseudoduganella lutea TaxID=321985 RepID=A0A4P6L650_9BURK|nr:hypothetical protein [Pseudoduganella lutea]QBE66342.1 hypothetical protein EWM63_27995 [Pseudoduganella lutea]
MAKKTYSVVAIRPGRRQDYSRFNQGVQVNDTGEQLHTDLLSLSVTIEAISRTDAENKVRARYPDHSIDSAATQQLG